MIPGRIARLSEETQASAATIGPVKSDIVLVTGTTAIDTITPFAGGLVWGQLICLIPTNAAGVVLSTSGNILVGITAAQHRGVWLAWVPSLAKWVINSGV